MSFFRIHTIQANRILFIHYFEMTGEKKKKSLTEFKRKDEGKNSLFCCCC